MQMQKQKLLKSRKNCKHACEFYFTSAMYSTAIYQNNKKIKYGVMKELQICIDNYIIIYL